MELACKIGKRCCKRELACFFCKKILMRKSGTMLSVAIFLNDNLIVIQNYVREEIYIIEQQLELKPE